MDNNEGFIIGVFVCVASAAISGALSYGAAKANMQEQAVAAKVACWQVSSEGNKSFTWDCPKPAK